MERHTPTPTCIHTRPVSSWTCFARADQQTVAVRIGKEKVWQTVSDEGAESDVRTIIRPKRKKQPAGDS